MLKNAKEKFSGDKNQVFFAGDTVCEGLIKFHSALESVLDGHAIKIFNFEGPLTQRKEKILKAGPYLQQQEKYIDSVTDKFNVAVLANNHTMDYGEEGLRYTLEQLQSRGVSTVGAGMNIDEAFAPLDIHNYRFIAVAEHEFGAASVDKPGIATVEESRRIYRLIREGKEDNRQVIMLFHGGVEVMPLPAVYVRELAKLWVDYGADVVVGTHPHVVQGYEVYKDKAIFYSLGNFIFDRPHFNQYLNADWSLGVSVNFLSEEVNLFPLIYKDGSVEISLDGKYMREVERLSGLISSNDYAQHCRQYYMQYYPERYARLMPNNDYDAALLLHYFRCDAHRHVVSNALAEKIGEHIVSEKGLQDQGNYEMSISAVSLDEKENLLNEAFSKMQMSADEKDYLTAVLKNIRSYLEIGSGFSTLWFPQFVETYHSVELRSEWYEEIASSLKKLELNNVELFHMPPESAAYDENGAERWMHRTPPDYGRLEEFQTYFNFIKKLLSEQRYDAVLVDGNLRYEITELLRDLRYDGVILLHDVLPERRYLNDPILGIGGITLVRQIGSLAELSAAPHRVEVGGNRNIPGWLVTDKDKLNAANPEDWKRLFEPESIQTIFCEHMLEHLKEDEIKSFFSSAADYLVDGGTIRIAVPDEKHPSQFYYDLCKPGGIAEGSDDQRHFFNYENIRHFFDQDVFELRLLEWWDDKKFHRANWNNTYKDGFVNRSAGFYKGRLTEDESLMNKLLESTPPDMRDELISNNISYTSLIFELVKKGDAGNALQGKNIYAENLSDDSIKITETAEKTVRGIFSTDWLASRPVFYNETNGEVSYSIGDVFQSDDFEFHPEGLKNFLDYGYSVFGQTPVLGVKMMPPNATLMQYTDGSFRIEKRDDPAVKLFGKTSNESDVLELIREKVNGWEKSFDKNSPLFLPLSGGYDSRLLASMVNDKSRIISCTFGVSDNQAMSSEKVKAEYAAKKLGIRWEHIPLEKIHNYFDLWDSLFGISTHAHGMYQLNFFDILKGKISKRSYFLSGIIGDGFSGNVSVPPVKGPDELINLGLTHGLNADSNALLLKSGTELRDRFWEENKEELKEEYFRIIALLRIKLVLLTYLLRVPEWFGYRVWSPYLHPDVAAGMLNLPANRRNNRIWQQDYFRKIGLDIESEPLQFDTANTLNLQALCQQKFSPLDAQLLKDIIHPDYIKAINMVLSDYTAPDRYIPGRANTNVLPAYSAYLTIKPIEKLLSKRGV